MAGTAARAETSSSATASPTPSARTRPGSSTTATPCPPRACPLFQAATANLNPWTEVKVDPANPERGPLLIIPGEKDHTVPWALTIDGGWREVADTALAFGKRFA
jgi:non-heme chloroperoxidase